MHVRVDKFEDFSGWKWFGQRTDRAEFLCLGEYLWTAVCGDEKNRNLRLKIANVCDYLKSGDVSEKQIDHSKSETPLAHLIYSIQSGRNKHNFIPVGLEH